MRESQAGRLIYTSVRVISQQVTDYLRNGAITCICFDQWGGQRKGRLRCWDGDSLIIIHRLIVRPYIELLYRQVATQVLRKIIHEWMLTRP